MTEFKARLARVSHAYEPGWGRDGERLFRRMAIGVGALMVAIQFL